MLLLALLIFLARSTGFPTSPAPSVPSAPHLLRRAPWDHPNPDTGLCDCPNTRSLAEIVWTCASTLILATWVSVHLNVPPKGASPFRLVVLRFGAMCSAILAPEVTLRWALLEWTEAKTLQERMVKKHSSWTMTHSFYLVMGGFALYDKKEEIYQPIRPQDFPWQVGERFDFPTISEEEIKDKSKGDGLTKTIAIFQLLWFSVQLIGRLIKGWAATELEVLTFATCIMTVAIYFFWWNKPLDVHCQTILEPKTDTAFPQWSNSPSVLLPFGVANADNGNGPAKQEEGQQCAPVKFFRQFKFFTSDPTPRHDFHRRIFEHNFGFKPILKVAFFPFLFLWETFRAGSEWGPDCADPISGEVHDRASALDQPIKLMFLSASAFGATHFITWSFSMPTMTELWMWRSASIALTSLPIIGTLLLFAARSLALSSINHLSKLVLFLAAALFFLHPVIRFAIAVDSVVLLRDLPDTAFLVLSWSDAIPSL